MMILQITYLDTENKIQSQGVVYKKFPGSWNFDEWVQENIVKPQGFTTFEEGSDDKGIFIPFHRIQMIYWLK